MFHRPSGDPPLIQASALVLWGAIGIVVGAVFGEAFGGPAGMTVTIVVWLARFAAPEFVRASKILRRRYKLGLPLFRNS